MPAQSPYWKAENPNGRNVKPVAVRGGAAKAPSAGQASGKKKRFVRTAAGQARYRVPIGAEIGTARNPEAAKAQKNKRASNHYNSLVGADDATVTKGLRWMDQARLTQISKLAYSFKSSNPHVVKLRVQIANELRRRGQDVNNHGGLGSKPRTKKKAPPAPQRKAAVRRTARPPIKKKVKPLSSASRKRIPGQHGFKLSNPSQLRQALAVFPRVSPANREAAARLLINQAVELNAVQFLGQSVIEAANLDWNGELGQQVIELAGKWKHGWIPLDAAAMRAKLKGGNSKPWWSGGKQSRRGSATMRKSVAGGRAARARKMNEPKLTGSAGGGSAPDRIPGGTWPGEAMPDGTKKPAKNWEFRKQADGTYTRYVDGKKSKKTIDQGYSLERARQLSGASAGRTSVVKSGGTRSPARGAKMTPDEIHARDSRELKNTNDAIRAAVARRRNERGAKMTPPQNPKVGDKTGDMLKPSATPIKSGALSARASNGPELSEQRRNQLTTRKTVLENLAKRRKMTKKEQAEYTRIKAALGSR